MTRHLAWSLAIAVVASGCGGSPMSRFYTLDAVAPAAGAAMANTSIVVGPVTVPTAVDRPQLVLQAGPNRVAVDEFNRWAGPLGESIATTVAGNLSVLLGTPRVVAGPIPGFDPAYRVTIDVQRFESTPGTDVLVDAVWIVHTTAGGATRTGRTVAREATSGAGIDAVAAAHSRAVARVSTDIAVAIRAAAARSR